MPRIRLEFDGLTLDADLFDTPTAQAVADALPLEARVMTWGEEVYFGIPVRVPLEDGARTLVDAGEIAYWPDGPALAIGFGRTPASRGDEIRLASAVNIFAKALTDVKALAVVRAGTRVRVSVIDG